MNHNISDITFAGLGGGLYQEWVGLTDEEQARPARLENWHPEDLAAFVGGEYTTQH